MTLKTTIRRNGKEQQVDLDSLDKFGYYFLHPQREFVIRAKVYTQGTWDSRHLRDDVEWGTDYELVPVDVDQSAACQQITSQLGIEVTDEELERPIREYRDAGHEVLRNFADDLGGDRILSRANNRVVSTDVDEPLPGWDSIFGDLVDRGCDANPGMSRRAVVRTLFTALQDSSPGDYEYSARIELIGPDD